jgi:enoyl-[acyl-carrier-protein] reductase (NADH)
LALEWGTDYGIRVNGIAPGPIGDTPGMRKLAPEEMGPQFRDEMPLFKLGQKIDIANAALYLASEAGGMILSCCCFVIFVSIIDYNCSESLNGIGFSFRQLYLYQPHP